MLLIGHDVLKVACEFETKLFWTVVLVELINNTSTDETINLNLFNKKSASKINVSEFWVNIDEYVVGEGKGW